jgi:DNA-binding NtrC family response regulator
VVLKASARIIAAANCNLDKRIQAGEFRQDLYYRLFILTVRMPLLRERKEDLELLIEFFINKFNGEYGLEHTGICARLLDKLLQHDWPGNVRELENTIHRYYLLSGNPIISEIETLEVDRQMVKTTTPLSADQPKQQQPTLIEGELIGPNSDTVLKDMIQHEDTIEVIFDFCDAKRKAIETFEAQFVSQLLHHANGNVTKAANLCGKERRAFGKLIKKYNIKRNDMHIE